MGILSEGSALQPACRGRGSLYLKNSSRRGNSKGVINFTASGPLWEGRKADRRGKRSYRRSNLPQKEGAPDRICSRGGLFCGRDCLFRSWDGSGPLDESNGGIFRGVIFSNGLG